MRLIRKIKRLKAEIEICQVLEAFLSKNPAREINKIYNEHLMRHFSGINK